MCGIIGFNFEDKSLLKKALKKLEHRGPDDSGTFFDKSLSLGQRRLSIIDLSKSGKQPMSNEEQTIWIIFNGEIYNFKQLKNQLQKQHEFKSNTDTEVLLHLYEEQGTNMLSQLQGMFSFCIYDSKAKTLFLARDRIGIKPLYYYHKDKTFMFASTISSILENKEIKKQINPEALSSFLTFRANTLEQSILNNIKKIMPGHFAIYNLKTNKLKIQKYWDFNYSPENKSESHYEKKLLSLLDDAVKSRLMSDVPYGAYLSGGIDSGTVVSLMSRHSPQPIKTFSVGFEQEQHTETNEARFLAEKLKTDHHELLINQDSIKQLPQIIQHSGEPMSDPTSIPIYFLSKYAKKHCTVILTGEGADEIFAGYPQYKFMKIHHKLLKKTPKLFRQNLPKIIHATPDTIKNKAFKFTSALGEKGIERFSNFINSEHPSEQYLNQISIFNQQEQEQLLNKKINLYESHENHFQNKDIVHNCQKLDFKNPMVDDLLMKVDKNTMAFSVEGRVPFLDHRIVELAAKIPSNLKLKSFTQDKHILRRATKNLVPKQTNKRKKKHFFVPIDSWFKNQLSNLTKDLLNKKYLKEQGIFEPRYIEKIEKQFKKSKLFYSRQLWSLIVFQIWYKQFIENEKVKI